MNLSRDRWFVAVLIGAAVTSSRPDVEALTGQLTIERLRLGGQLDAVSELDIQDLLRQDPRLAELPLLRQEAKPVTSPIRGPAQR